MIGFAGWESPARKSVSTSGRGTLVKGLGRRTHLLDDLRNKRRYWELKEEVEDRKRWR